MPLYCYAYETIESQMALDELPISSLVSPSDSSFFFHQFAAPPPELANLKWIQQRENDSPGTFQSLARSGEKFVLRFHGLADFIISKDGRQIGVWSRPNTTDETLRHLFLDQIMPRILGHQNQLVVHAGTVRVGNHAIAFVGETGAGKSSLTASFHINGYPLLSDDGIVVKLSTTGTMALPTYPSLRLWPEAIKALYTEEPPVAPVAHYFTKQRILIDETKESTKVPLPLAALFLLAPREETCSGITSISRLLPGEACITLIANTFLLDDSDKQRAATRFKNAAAISQSLPAFRIEHVRDFATLPALRTKILKHVEHNLMM